ncbi:hypothetical chloroplast RF1 [Lentinula edodes]|uniref:Hypothetical chloroplast RF1 n=1 Tax=Lentinula edodes TaxID=5353 RepID=A0A1Q3ECJ3_LENED|nr:hypothetical protein HHX47_DHR2000774 [Lentinula edodes]GAW04911.1 hypothetical chloroplast RF1 [Lentinula edodes]
MAANPIALLAQGPNHQYGRIGLPQNPPQNPPTPAEVIEAVRLANRALRYRDDAAPPTSNEYVSDEAVAACFCYKEAVIKSGTGVAGAPLWFQQWNQANFVPLVNDVNNIKDDVNNIKDNVNNIKDDVNNIKENVNTIKDDVNTLKDDVSTIKDSVNTLRLDTSTLLIRDGKDCNGQRNVNNSGPFYEIPFSDGRKPWGLSVDRPGHPNVILPRLDNQASIDNLTYDQSYAYFAGYYPNMPVLNTGPNTLRDWKLAIARVIGHVA